MNKKLVVIVILIIIMVFLSSCEVNNINAPEKTIEDSLQKEYEITKETYTDANLTLEYPQIKYLNDNEKLELINNLIKNNAIELYQNTINELEPNQKYEADGKYEVKYKSQNLLSIAYTSYNNISPSAYPYYLFHTINIDMKTGKRLLLKDLVPVIDQRFVDLLKKAKYVGETDKEYEQQLRDSAFGMYESDEKLINILYGKDKQESFYVYVTNDALGISLPVPHVLGDHAEFEINVKDLEGLIINLD